MRKVLARLWALRRAILFYVCLFTLGWFAGEFLRDVAIPEMRPMNEPLIHRIVMGALLVFVLAAAIPFVPGAEIGFALLMVFGAQASFLVYSGMVGALLLSYGVARLVPSGTLARIVRWMGLRRAAAFVARIEATPVEDRAAMLSRDLDGRFGKLALRNRYVLFILLLNMPGNTVLGGGGGLAFMAGISGLYRFWPFLLTVLIAVAPFPLLFLLHKG